MSFINAHYNNRSGKMHIWEEIEGERFYDIVDWVPYVFIKTNKSDISTIDGIPVAKKEFRSYNDYYEFCKENVAYENKVKAEIQFLAERYHHISDKGMSVPKLKIYTIDIECLSEGAFPDIQKADDPITLISIRDNQSKKVTTFGVKPYTGDTDVIYHQHDESELLLRFFNYMYKKSPDVITGWNVYGFDIPYIINRTKNIFGEDTEHYQKLSPIKNVRTWHSERFNEMNVDIAGVHILDYLDIYKWYTPNKLESYALNFVSNFELEKGKLDYSEYKDLRELCIKDWNKYVDYNIVDVKRVDELEDKLGYIRLIQSLSLLTKCPMKYYQAMTQLIEGALLTHFRRNNLCAPFLAGGHQKGFPAAYVKEPDKGMHKWVIDIDIESSYPFHIMTLNMSNETYYGRIIGLQHRDVVKYVREKQFPPFDLSKDGKIVYFDTGKLQMFNKALERGLFAVAPCGSIFNTTSPGMLASVERSIFIKRVEVKNKMKAMKAKIQTPGDEFDVKAKELFSLQWAIKILLNAMFGVLAVPYSRYFNVNIAEAITSCGRHTIKQGENFVNEWLREKADTQEDFVAYIDTDSLFIKLGHYFKDMEDFVNADDQGKIDIILDFSTQLENYVNDKTFTNTQLIDYNSQVKDLKIRFKQEIVAKRALFVKKKKYAYWMVNDEGNPCDKLQVTGLEIVRSDSAEAVRERLKTVYTMIMKGATDDELVNIIGRYKKELRNVAPEEIAANIGVNNIEKYLSTGKPIKHTPWHVKGVWNYRNLLKRFDLGNDYDDIHEGNKAKVVYLKKNKFNIDVLTYQRWPKEFDKHLIIDWDTMIDKFFLKKIGFLLTPMGKVSLLTSGEAEKTMDLFFG